MPNPPKIVLSFLAKTPLGKKLSIDSNNGSKWIVPLFMTVIILLIIGGYFLLQSFIKSTSGIVVSGAIEATEIHLGSEVGGLVDRVNVHEGEKVSNGQVVAEVHGDKVHAPIDGVVLDRAAEPGEIVAQGTTLVTLTDLNSLTLTVYVPEDKYGQIILGQACPVTVDSFPGQTFNGTVSHISEKAEFTPRNVQTTDSRKDTVFAIKLDMAPSNGLLKPGMPADVHFQNVH